MGREIGGSAGEGGVGYVGMGAADFRGGDGGSKKEEEEEGCGKEGGW